ncbi:MAG TPA: TetR family transcriptional regulator [Parvularcula sp.]|nr:TetR family transcriptional regulator [Parvularcula sp.]HBS33295.1 TetR family transcriptional regulator [Parvularcula sp.]HBS35692.1 TetR family transcriptional regulator [Parvularcula sp.]
MSAERKFDRDEVLDRAMQAFWARGYQATSIQDIVDITGVNRASLYQTYGDKRELFLACLKLYDRTRRRQVLENLEENHPPVEAIRSLFAGFVAAATRRGGIKGCFLTNIALELAPYDPAVRRFVARSQKEIESFFERMVRKGKEQGVIPDRVRSEDAARGLLAALLGLIVLTRSQPDLQLLTGVVDDAMNRLA